MSEVNENAVIGQPADLPADTVAAVAEDLHERLAAQAGFDPELGDWAEWWRQQVADALKAVKIPVRAADGAQPPIVCLCGSTRFYRAFQEARLRLTLQGEIVLTIGCDTASDGDLVAAGSLGQEVTQAKAALNELHKRKIDLADYVLVLNAGGYIGQSTRSEIDYAEDHGKPVHYLEPQS